jgi:hypothetical protein
VAPCIISRKQLWLQSSKKLWNYGLFNHVIGKFGLQNCPDIIQHIVKTEGNCLHHILLLVGQEVVDIWRDLYGSILCGLKKYYSFSEKFLEQLLLHSHSNLVFLDLIVVMVWSFILIVSAVVKVRRGRHNSCRNCKALKRFPLLQKRVWKLWEKGCSRYCLGAVSCITSKIRKVHFLEYAEIWKVFFTPHDSWWQQGRESQMQ